MVRWSSNAKRTDPLTDAIGGPFLNDSEYDAVLQMALLPDTEWTRQAQFRPALRSPITVADLIRHSRWFLGRDPQKSIVIAEVAIRIAAAQREGETVRAEADHKRAEAWQAYAAGLTECQDYHDALKAVVTAERFYDASRVMRAEGRPSLDLIRARILAESGDTRSALQLAENAATLFLSLFEDRTRCVMARFFCANILLKEERYQEAINALDRAAEIAYEQGDTEMLAHIVASTGYALQGIGNRHERARGCQEHAIEMFEWLGMPVELAQVRLTMARGFILRGEYNEAIAALRASREEFLQLDLPIAAAEVAVDAANALLLAGRGRWIEQLCNEAIATFVRANLPREAQKALAYLREAASVQQHRAWPADRVERAISYVKEFLDRLRRDPELPFDEPQATPDA